MLNKDLIKLLYSQNYGYADIAKEFGVSRQRIHQILKNYKNHSRDGRLKKYRLLLNDCAKCKKIATVLHHKDLDNSNDNIENLLPLCLKCHKKIHTGEPHISHKKNGWSRDYKLCKGCHTTERPHVGKGYCMRCCMRIRLNIPLDFSF